MSFGHHIRALRKAQKLSVRQLGGAMGLDPTYVSRIENGKIESPSEDVIVRLARALGEDPDVLLGVAGKVSAEVQRIISKRPRSFIALIRQLKDAPDHVLDDVAREVRDGDW